MQVQFPKKTLRCLDKAVQDVKRTEVSQELRLSDGMPDIGRVLTAWGQVILRSKQWQSEEISLSGGVKMWVLYSPEDGTEPRMAEGWLPFQLKWDARTNGREGPVRMIPLLQFADARSISARKMMLRAGVSVMAQGFCRMECEICVPEELPEDVQLLKRTYPVRLPGEAGEKTFLLDEDLDLKTMGLADGKLVSASVFPHVSESRVLTDRIITKGMGKLHLVFRDGEGRIQNRNLELPFSQFADLSGTFGQEAEADVRVALTDLEADAMENGLLRIKCGMVAQYLVTDRHLVETAEDACSHCRDVSFETEELALPAVLDTKTEQIDGELRLQGQYETLADVCFYPDYPKIRQSDERELELSGTFQILCYGEGDSLRGESHRWETTHRIPMDDSCSLTAVPEPAGSVRIMTDAVGMAVNCPMELQLRTESGRGVPMIGSLELGQQRDPDPDRPTLIIRRAGDESLWEIAKKTGSTVEAIRKANQIADQPAENQMLLIPVL